MLKLVCDSLTNEQRKLTVADRPDRPGGNKGNVTVDALIEVVESGSTRMWAADVCLASKKFDPRTPAAMAALKRSLLPRLEVLAAEVGRAVMVGCRPYVRSSDRNPKEWAALMVEYEQNIYDRVWMAARRVSGMWHDAEVGISWQGEGSTFPWGRVMLSYYDARINEGFRFSEAVHKKLENQLPRARAAGYPTLLILDQKAPDYVDWVINSEPTPFDIGQGLAFSTSYLKAKLDAAVLVNSDDSVHEVYGKVSCETQD
ncbi:hypothetical protein P3T36_003728 [Kitasatospora sp. MAP12-15]|uniref:hypothetical protein n=1 Tax=unclassified Kitasatospora TaxID=2633591 RepID=UPI002475281E|nr:hypothetical protein [Kitasatospora sp. MAP12-44]MDH6112316.1 hypothetical protein [Kitasatospora sp. MAP12-44]